MVPSGPPGAGRLHDRIFQISEARGRDPSGPGPARRRARRRYASAVLVHRLGDVRIRDDLVGDVVAVLLRVEHSPGPIERSGDLGPQDTGWRGVAVRDVDASDLVVAVVAEARSPEQR